MRRASLTSAAWILALAAALVVPQGARAASTGNPGDAPVVEDPCDPMPATSVCLQAYLVAPSDRQEVVLPLGKVDFVFRGVAERDSQVSIYIIDDATGALLTLIPYDVRAKSDGTFEKTIRIAAYGEGHFKAAAYFEASLKEHPNAESFFQVTGTPVVRYSVAFERVQAGPVCGNTRVEPGEECDLGTSNGQGRGCSSECKHDTPPPDKCGDGVLDAGEECDDGNTNDGDACTGQCRTEPPTFTCGDGNQEPGEQCDDGNLLPGDGCTSQCRTEVIQDCSAYADLNTQVAFAGQNVYKLDRFGKHGFVLLEDEGGAGDVAGLQQIIWAAADEQVKRAYCRDCGQTCVGATAVDEGVLRTTLDRLWVGAFNDGRARVDQEIHADPACTQQQVDEGMDEATWGKNDGNTDNIGAVYYAPYGVWYGASHAICTLGGIRKYVSHITGVSPLVFVRGGAATVRPSRVSFADPPLAGGAWSVVGDGTATPRYYEFDRAALPELRLLPGGWSVPSTELEATLRTLLTTLGYDPSEVAALIDRDVRPALPDAPFVELRVYDPASVARALPLLVTPPPARVDRLLLQLTPAAGHRTLPPAPTQDLHAAGASGLTVRELGAVILPPR